MKRTQPHYKYHNHFASHRSNPIVPSIDSRTPHKITEPPKNGMEKHACHYCKQLNTKSFAMSTTKSNKNPVDPPPSNQYYNCQSTSVVYLITCNYEKFGAQYIGYTMWKLHKRLWAQNSLWEPITKPLLHTQPSTIQTGCTILKHHQMNQTLNSGWNKNTIGYANLAH